MTGKDSEQPHEASSLPVARDHESPMTDTPVVSSFPLRTQPSLPDPQFDEFWEFYPRKVGKGAARRNWHIETVRRRADPQRIIAAARRYRDQCREKDSDPKYIPHPGTWLREERYNDEMVIAPDPALPAKHAAETDSPSQPSEEQLLAVVIRLSGDQERPVSAAEAIILAVRQHAPVVTETFPVVSAERGLELAAMPYSDYLLMPEWQARRTVKLKTAGYRCQVCYGSHDLNVHHRTYERRGMEQPSDLTVLCEKCHLLFHREGRLVKGDEAA